MSFARLVTVAVCTATLLTGVPAPSPAWAAATACRSTARAFSLPSKPDVTVKVRICTRRRASSTGRWWWCDAWVDRVSWDGSSFYLGSGKRFNDLFVRVWLRRGGLPGDHVDERITDPVNEQEAGTAAGFYGAASVRSGRGGWRAGGAVFAEVADDGRGYLVGRLASTGRVR
jgi:hypothetical protein